MHIRTWFVPSLALLAVVADTAVASASTSTRSSENDQLRDLGGEWLYVEDITEDRASEEQGPPMSPRFMLRVESDAVFWERPRGDERIALDGSVNEVPQGNSIYRYRGTWKDGVLAYETEILKASDRSRATLLRKEFRPSPDGLVVRIVIGEPPELDSHALYKHPEDIAQPEAANAGIEDLDWLAGGWVGTSNSSSIEERWGPPLGGAMLGVSRTVKSDRMTGFEYLRIVERKGGLIYVAQPGGNPPTEFVLTEFDIGYAVFENPRHDYPQRIVYELTDDNLLTTSIGYIHGGSPRYFDYTREEL